MKESSSISVFNNRGFTLIEILIAITLLAFITLGVVSVTENAFRTKDRTTEINKNNLQIETAMSRFEWDFSQLYSPLFFSTVFKTTQNKPAINNTTNNNIPNNNSTVPPDANNVQIDPALQDYYQQILTRFERNEHFISITQDGMPIPRFYAPEKTIFEFFTTSNRRKRENTKQSHFAWVLYTLSESEQKVDAVENENIPKGLKTLVRYFTADDPYHDKRINLDDHRIKGTILLENVESLEFQFWDYARKKWETNLKTVQGGESLLRGVKIILSWYDSSGIKRTSERIFRNHWPVFVPEDSSTLNRNNVPAAPGNNNNDANNTNNDNNDANNNNQPTN